MINGFVYLDRKLRSVEEAKELEDAAKADEHGIFSPTFFIRKEGKVVGYFSIGSQAWPMTTAWLSTKELHARESFSLINSVENHVSVNGGQGLIWPIPKQSPFYPIMETLGYKNVGTYDLFLKGL